ncbi:unnamed protein product [Cladocopium goreaui]|uniref:CPC1/SPEF2 domain-containing protein n=1 Tax=Cladocopium goreaui TaxID=2562237 RepID=A0A9P1GM32_9DINO|nr:unnamed protein product [Cladocopium goreaui]
MRRRGDGGWPDKMVQRGKKVRFQEDDLGHFEAFLGPYIFRCHHGIHDRLLYQLKMASERRSHWRGGVGCGSCVFFPWKKVEFLENPHGFVHVSMGQRNFNGEPTLTDSWVPVPMGQTRSERPALALQASALEMQASVGWPGASMKVRQARVEKLTRKFELEKHKQEIVAYEMDNIEQAHVEEQRQIHRFSLRERLRQNRAAKDEWEARGHELWQDNMKVRMARETEQMRFSDKVFRTQQEKEQQQRRFAASEVLQGTKDFEAGLQNLGITKAIEEGMPEDSSGEDDDATAERLLAQTSKVASAKELVDALQAKLPTNQELNYEAGLFMRKIKESKQAGTIARRERERRRRRVLVEQQREQEMLEENQLEQVLMEKLNRESIEESAISYRSWRAKTFEEVFVRNRQARQQQYIAKKKADKEEAVQRLRLYPFGSLLDWILAFCEDLRDEMIETLREQEERERVRYRAVERFRHAKRREKLREEMEGILELIVQMAFADLQQEQLTDKEEVDSTLWREWVALFEENLPVMPLPSLQMCAEEPAPLTALPEPTGLANLHSVGATLNSAALRDFMDARGQWQVPMVEGDDEELQEEVPASQPTVEAFNADAEVAATLEEAQGVRPHCGAKVGMASSAALIIIFRSGKDTVACLEGLGARLAPGAGITADQSGNLMGLGPRLARGRLARGLLSLCFAMAFLSFWWQADGLVGPKGIFPIADQGMPKVQAVEKVRSTDWVRTGSVGSQNLWALGNPGTLEPEVINTSADLQVTV